MLRTTSKQRFVTLCLITILTLTSLSSTTGTLDSRVQAERINSSTDTLIQLSSTNSDPIWRYTYNGPSGGDSQFESVYQLSNGDFAATGSQMTSNGLDWFTIRTDAAGGGEDEGQDWTDSRGSSSSEKAFSITQASGGDDVVAAGYYINNGEDYSLKRLDDTGASVWVRSYTEPYNQRAYQIITCSDGSFAIAGSYQFSLGAPPKAFILKTYGTGYENWRADFGGINADEAFSVVECTNGDFVLVGYTKSLGGSDRDLWVIRIDNTGTEIWNQVYGLSFDDWGEEVVQCKDGGFAIVGTTRSYGGSDQDVWLVRLDGAGNLLWHQFFGGVLDDYGKSIVECDDGFAITGTTESYGSGGGDVWLIRTDDSGNMLWHNEYGGSGADNGNSIVRCLDGGFVIAGGSKTWGGSDNDAFLMKVPDPPVWLVEPEDQDLEYGIAFRYALEAAATYIDEWWVDDEAQFSIDSQGVITNDVILPVGDHTLQISVNDTLGNVLRKTITIAVTYTPAAHPWDSLWQRTFGASEDDHGKSISLCANGDIVIAGYGSIYGTGNLDAWLARCDSFGNLLWNKTYGGSLDDRIHTVIECANGDFACAGISSSVNVTYGYQAWVFRTDSAGTMQWQFNLGGQYTQNATAMCQTSDGGFAVTGYTTTAGFEKDLILFKVNATGNLEWSVTNVDSFDQEGLSVIEYSSGDIYAVGYNASGSAKSTRRGFIYSTDSNGNSPTSKTFTASARNEFWDVIQTGSSLLVVGSLDVSGNLDIYWAFITESSLVISLENHEGGASIDYGVSVTVENNGDFIVLGNTMSYGVDGVDAIIMRISPAGALEWYRTYGGSGNDLGSDILHLDSGEYLFIGSSNSIGSGSYDIWLVCVQPVQWLEIPENQVIEYGQGIRYNFSILVSPSVSVDTFSLNDTADFELTAVSGKFMLTNKSVTPTGEYNLRLWVNDTNGEFLNVTFQVTVEPSEAPVFAETPTDQIAEFGYTFSYTLNATDTAGIDNWWLNDSVRFTVSFDGVITNATYLPIGTYGIDLVVTDILGNFREETFDIIVMDTTPPSWLHEPKDVYLVQGENLNYDIGAEDLSGIDTWWVNDTVRFNTTQMGIITTMYTLDVGIYGLEINVNDTQGQLSTSRITVFVQIDPPIWIIMPANRVAEYAQPFSYGLTATSIASLDQWGLNDTGNFRVDELGVVTNATNLEIGEYGLTVWVEDIWQQRISAEFTVAVRDTTAPTWIKAPTNQTIEYGNPLNIIFSARDASNVSYWSVDNTTHFGITSVGRLVNLTTLPVGTYWITITAYDTYMNSESERIAVNIVESQAPTWTTMPEDQTVEFGSDLRYELEVYDYSGIGSFTVSDDANFLINAEGVLTNALPLQVGVYELEILVSDIIGNTASASFNVIVEDTTPPIWIEGPRNQGLIIGEHLQMQLSAWDMSGIGAWAVSDEVQFQIDNNGLLRDTDNMQPGVHNINVTVSDIYGNERATQFVIVVRAIEAGGPNISLAAIVVFGVTGAVIVVMLSTFCLFRRRGIILSPQTRTVDTRAPGGGKKKK